MHKLIQAQHSNIRRKATGKKWNIGAVYGLDIAFKGAIKGIDLIKVLGICCVMIISPIYILGHAHL